MKCTNCGFDEPIDKWMGQEESGLMKLPEETIKQYENYVDQQNSQKLLNFLLNSCFASSANLDSCPITKLFSSVLNAVQKHERCHISSL